MKTYEIPSNLKYFFYVAKKRFDKQKQLYNTFVVRREIPVETLIYCMEKLRTDLNISKRKDLLHKLSERDNTAFPMLLEIITEKTGLTFKKRVKFDAYDDWYQEASMDGSLAYEGVADDF